MSEAMVRILTLPILMTAGGDGLHDIRGVPADLVAPVMTDEDPAPGKRVRQVLDPYSDTGVYHALYLPTDWAPDRTYPVIVEYAGNGPYANGHGDRCTGRLEDCTLGYGVSGGEGFVWICLPYISHDGQQNQLK